MNTFPIYSKSGANEVRIRIITCSYSSGQIQDQNRDSQLSLFLPFKWGLNSSDASSVSDVRDASNASKVSDAIFVSDASNATLVKLVTLFSLVSLVTLTVVSPVTSVTILMDDINVMMSVMLPMPVRLLLFLCSIEVRVVVTLVTSVASGTRVTLVRLVSWR